MRQKDTVSKSHFNLPNDNLDAREWRELRFRC